MRGVRDVYGMFGVFIIHIYLRSIDQSIDSDSRSSMVPRPCTTFILACASPKITAYTS